MEISLYLPRPSSIAVVSRAKLYGPGRHYGVALSDEFGRVYAIVDLSRGVGLDVKRPEAFLQGRHLQRDALLTRPNEVEKAYRRLEDALRDPTGWAYDLGRTNCEHFAYDMVLGEAESKQVNLCIAGGVVALFSLLAYYDRAG